VIGSRGTAAPAEGSREVIDRELKRQERAERDKRKHGEGEAAQEQKRSR
jgi:hypothetical protein